MGSLRLRLVLLGVGVVVVQVAAVSQLTVFSTNADLTPLVIAFAGFLCGSLTGATFGFAVGFLLDAALVQTLGLTSLVGIAAGYGAGRWREGQDPQGTLVPMALAAGATVIVLLGYSVMQFLLGTEAPVSYLLARQIAATTIVNTLIALPVFVLVRRWLTPGLPDDPRRSRRRRAYTTGGLSPLSRA